MANASGPFFVYVRLPLKSVRNLQWQQGFSLIEFLLSCSLGLFLLLGLMQNYLAVKKTLTMQQAFTGLQENARFAIHFLNQNIRAAGYSGCAKTPPFISPDKILQGYQSQLPDYLKGKVKTGTDSMVVGLCRTEQGKLQFQQYAFFIGSTSRKNVLGKPVYALYETTPSGSKQELVANVEMMQIRYGVLTADGKNIASYLLADQIKDWNSIASIEISLLFSSDYPLFSQPMPYSFVGKAMPADRFLHREWDTYIVLRNWSRAG